MPRESVWFAAVRFARMVLLAALSAASVIPAGAAEPAIAFGSKYAVALRNNGEVLTWGENIYCQLGRRTGANNGTTPVVMMRNVQQIAAMGTHTIALTTDGKVYGWGENPSGALGVGDEFEKCEGPELIRSLEGKTIVSIATGYDFSVAVTNEGELYCAGGNDVLQCPIGRGGQKTFTAVPLPEVVAKVESVRSGMFHTLVRTKDGRLYAFGRGREGQLGNGATTNGSGLVADLPDVVSFSAGIWHSVALRADGSVWTWGSNLKSQLCDGTTTNRSRPTKIALPGGARAVQVIAGAHTTAIRTSDGALYVCGENQSGALGLPPAILAEPTLVPGAPIKSPVVAMGGSNSAFSSDGCSVRIAGYNDGGVIDGAGSATAKTFVARAGLSLCGPVATAAQPTLVFEWEKGGASGCWAARKEEDAAVSAKFAGLRRAMLAAEDLLKKNAVFLAAPEPVRMRSQLSAGPGNEGGARIHVKAIHERKEGGTRVWTGPCEVIPQIDRIGGAIFQVSVFFNYDVRDQFLGADGPKLTGRVGGFPEYNNWVVITKDGRLPWIPVTLADKLDAEAARRKNVLAEWTKTRASAKVLDPAALQQTYESLKKMDPTGADKFMEDMRAQAREADRLQREVYPLTTAKFEKQVQDVETYRASFTAVELRMAAVWGDASGAGRRALDAEQAALRALSPAEQAEIDALGRESRALERQAQTETANRNTESATKLRAQSTELALKVRAIRATHLERTAPLIDDAHARYQLTNLRPGPAEQAMSYKMDPAFPDRTDPNRIQLITVMFSEDPNPRQVERRAWQLKTKESFDFAALAGLLD